MLAIEKSHFSFLGFPDLSKNATYRQEVDCLPAGSRPSHEVVCIKDLLVGQ
jgi:hypothetical protein